MINKLRDILCEGSEEVRKDLMELKFGCKVKIQCAEKGLNKNKGSELINIGVSNGYMSADKNYAHINGFQQVNIEYDNMDDNSMSFDMADYRDKFYWIKEVIGNPLEERHLRMYVKKKYQDGLTISIDFNSLGHLYSNTWAIICNLDDTHSLQDQSDEVIGKIIEFLESNK